MTMTNEEICRDYRQSKKRLAQIQILAQLNNCGRDKIVEILKEGGEELPGQYKPKPKGKREPKTEAYEMVSPAPEKKKDEDAGAAIKIRALLPSMIDLAALKAIRSIVAEDYDPAAKAYRIEGVLDLWSEITKVHKDE